MSNYYSQLLAKTFDSLEALRHYEGIELRRRRTLTAEEEAFDKLPAEKVRALVERAVMDDQTKAAQIQGNVDISAFVAAHPEYDEYCAENNGAMKYTLEGMGIDTTKGIVTFEQLEDAYNRLKAGGFIKLKDSALKQQKETAVANRVKEVQGQSFDEWDAYHNLSTEELRQRASDQLAGIRRVSHDGVGSMGAEYGETVKPLNESASSVLDDRQRILTPGSSFSRSGFSESNRF